LTLFLRDITEVLAKTPVLEGGALKSIFTGKSLSDENLSFTIRFGRGELQFVCASQEQFDICMLGLYHVVTGAYLAFEQDATKQYVHLCYLLNFLFNLIDIYIYDYTEWLEGIG
jgi:hypothetical protein